MPDAYGVIPKGLTTVGRPTPHKNLGRLIEALAELQKTRPDLHLALAGKKDASYDHHEATAKIGEVVDDPVLRADLTDKGKVQAAKYSWDRMAEQTLAVYEHALSKK